MIIRLTKLTKEHHRFEIIRDGGVTDSREMETRSLLLHDLVHFAVETEAGLKHAFYGQLAAGRDYDDLTMPGGGGGAEPMQTERIVGIMQSASRRDDWPSVDPAAFAVRLADSFRSAGAEPPAWLTGEFIAGARERLRQVLGQWRATPFGQTMELEF